MRDYKKDMSSDKNCLVFQIKIIKAEDSSEIRKAYWIGMNSCFWSLRALSSSGSIRLLSEAASYKGVEAIKLSGSFPFKKATSISLREKEV